jgi:hypothetical protein
MRWSPFGWRVAGESRFVSLRAVNASVNEGFQIRTLTARVLPSLCRSLGSRLLDAGRLLTAGDCSLQDRGLQGFMVAVGKLPARVERRLGLNADSDHRYLVFG